MAAATPMAPGIEILGYRRWSPPGPRIRETPSQSSRLPSVALLESGGHLRCLNRGAELGWPCLEAFMAPGAWLRTPPLSFFPLVPLASPAGAAEKAPARQQDRGFVAWVWHAVSEIQKTLLPGITTKADSRG